VNDLTPAGSRWLAEHHGVVTTAVLRSTGVSRATTDRLVRAGVLRVAHKGVYVLTATKSTLEQRCAVLSAAHPAGFITGPTAGTLYDLRRMPRTASLHLACRHGVHLPREIGVKFRQTRAIAPDDRRCRPDGIIVARPARVAFDLAIDRSPLDHLSVLHQLVERRLVTYSELATIGQRLCHPARPGSGRFVKSLNKLKGTAPADSHPRGHLGRSPPATSSSGRGADHRGS
jgi:hypothetical protein